MYICSMLARVWATLEQSGSEGEPVENDPGEGGPVLHSCADKVDYSLLIPASLRVDGNFPCVG